MVKWIQNWWQMLPRKNHASERDSFILQPWFRNNLVDSTNSYIWNAPHVNIRPAKFNFQDSTNGSLPNTLILETPVTFRQREFTRKALLLFSRILINVRPDDLASVVWQFEIIEALDLRFHSRLIRRFRGKRIQLHYRRVSSKEIPGAQAH